MSSAGSELCCEILLLLDMDQRSEHLVHLVHMNRLSACRDVCGMYSWKNGTRCRDGVEVLWCHSHLVWLVLEGSIQKTLCDLFLLLF